MKFDMVIKFEDGTEARYAFEAQTHLWQFAWREIDGAVTPVLEECNGHIAVGRKKP
jgi:hypothetical protein